MTTTTPGISNDHHPTDEATTTIAHPSHPFTSPHPSSSLPTIRQRHHTLLARLASLERRLASRVAFHRRRAANLLEETPRYRRTHARIFVSHRVLDEELEKEEDKVEEEDVDRSGEHTEKETKEEEDHSDTNDKKDGTSPAAVVARGGGKDFQTLLHSAAAHREGGGDGKVDVDVVEKTCQADDEKVTHERETSPEKNAAPKRTWTLVIEGGLLVGNLDHESARGVDKRLEEGLPILGWRCGGDRVGVGVGGANGEGEEQPSENERDETKNAKGDAKSTSDAVAERNDDRFRDGAHSATNVRATIPLRDQWRGGVTEREGEWNVEPLLFTHLFDRLEVEFRTNAHTTKTTTTTTTVTWERRRDDTPDARAFFVSMPEWGRWETIDRDEEDAVDGTVAVKDDAVESARAEKTGKKRRAVYDDNTCIDTVIKLYPRLPDSSGRKDNDHVNNNNDDDDSDDDDDDYDNNYDNDTTDKGHDYNDCQTYIPSTEMCRVFFPTFIGEMAHEMKRREMQRAQSGGKKSGKKRKRSLESADSAALKAMRKDGASDVAGATATADAAAATSSSFSAPAAAHATAATTSSSTAAAIPPSASNAKSLQPPSRTQPQPQPQPQPPPKEEKDVSIPHALTMDEALSTLFYYVRTRHLQDPTDLSIVNNDETLTRLFGCQRMLLSSVRGLLLQRGLLVKVTNDGGMRRRDVFKDGKKGGTQVPVVLRYRMTVEGAEPLARKGSGREAEGEGGSAARSSGGAAAASASAAGGSSINTRRRLLNDNHNNNDADDGKGNDKGNDPAQQSLSKHETDVSKPNAIHANTATTSSSSSSQQRRQPTTTPPPPPLYHQTILSCDIDVTIPSLLQPRLRDILRRTKYREFEYTSSRTKANKYLVATKVEEETAKAVLEDVVTGKGYMPHHRLAWMALARGSHRGGEAERAAWIDLRTVALMEGVEERCAMVRGLWDVVEACRGL